MSDGVPTPTLTWYKPDGSQVNSTTAAQNTVNAKMSMDQDFGSYKCDADNGITSADFKIVKIEQISRLFCSSFKVSCFVLSFNLISLVITKRTKCHSRILLL